MYAVIQEVLKPFPLLMLLTGVSLIFVWRRSPDMRRRLRVVLVLYGLLLVDSLPLTAYLAAGWLERSFPKITSRPDDTKVIVVLAGGVIQPRSAGEPTLPDYATFMRTYRAWELYRDGEPCPILLSGGEPDPHAPGEPAAVVMAEMLRKMGVDEPHLIIEGESRTTAENAEFAARILRERQLTEGVLMVTTATHLWRSERQFRHQGVEVTPVGCDYFADRMPISPSLLWPSGNAVTMNQHVWHEVLGAIWYRLRGRW